MSQAPAVKRERYEVVCYPSGPGYEPYRSGNYSTRADAQRAADTFTECHAEHTIEVKS